MTDIDISQQIENSPAISVQSEQEESKESNIGVEQLNNHVTRLQGISTLLQKEQTFRLKLIERLLESEVKLVLTKVAISGQSQLARRAKALESELKE